MNPSLFLTRGMRITQDSSLLAGWEEENNQESSFSRGREEGYPGVGRVVYPGVVPCPAVHHPCTTLGTPARVNFSMHQVADLARQANGSPLTQTLSEQRVTDAPVTAGYY